MSQAATPVALARSQFDYLPIGLFGSVMGLTGLSVAWRLAQARYGGPAWLALAAPTIGVIAVVTFLALLAGYAVKLLTAFDAVRAEFSHPIAANLFGTFLISLLLLQSCSRPSASSWRRRCGSSARSA
jgi:tellurite resistance protein